jgi:hypothetical protein
MVWYKAWLDTRWRFVVPLVVLVFNIWGLVYEYAPIAHVLPTLHADSVGGGALGRAIQEGIAAEHTYQGFIWYQWFRQNLMQIGTLCAALLGSGNLLSGRTGSALFTLSMPASRNRWLAVRATMGLGQSFALALVPSMVFPLMSPAIGQHYDLATAIVHAICAFAVSAVFFSLAFLLSTVFPDIPRPLLIVCGVAIVLGLIETQFDLHGLFHVMSGSTYFHTGSLPWAGLLISGVLSATLLGGAAINIARKDF